MGQMIINGLTTGLILALPALALSLTFSVLRFPNYAIGSYVTVGAFVTWYANIVLQLPLWLAASSGAIATGLIAIGIDYVSYRHLRDRSGLILLVASMGIGIALENIVRLFAGNSPRSFDLAVARPFRFWGLRVNQEQLIIVATVLASLLAVWLVFRFSKLGRAMRAVADNPSLAASRGIERGKVVASVWAISGALAALAGVLIGIDTNIEPQMGWNYLLQVFTAAILGGIASPMAAVAGAVVLGLAEEFATLFMAAHYRLIVAFGIMTLLLIVRPWGIFGTKWVQR
ncbi:branched-chain amino acid ABC transporter permease [Agrobacterium sp. Ap1]|uniref:branched-chain amino acid ABC transporter permease n=1 Tax=Rhizobium/Agrobacterium group TaxID=227290 RepID=UPI001572EC8C|nr:MULTISPECIES: branched-chain amino acid ABC transporter permease [Rhizobium/Agrobacterium group]MBO0145195.1 branched-chain amino acid ABC transporter permease [Agrobacterium sp. Ap1]NTF98462.1 branched-chain amino acid ABC transporter permease [Rhizobium rhizogenes]